MARTSTTTTLRLSANERAALDEAAAIAGLGPSAFARLAVVKASGGEPVPTRKRRTSTAKALTAVLGELGRIGNNVNQLAHQANRSKFVSPTEIAAVKAELERLTISVMSLRE